MNDRHLFECVRVLREALFLPVVLYGSETLVWRKKESSRIRAVQMTISDIFWVLRKGKEYRL